jgi:hypothetical protein
VQFAPDCHFLRPKKLSQTFCRCRT